LTANIGTTLKLHPPRFAHRPRPHAVGFIVAQELLAGRVHFKTRPAQSAMRPRWETIVDWQPTATSQAGQPRLRVVSDHLRWWLSLAII
jgi:hypothetical protein